MDHDNLELRQHGPVTVVCISRPDKLNALDRSTISQLDSAVAYLLEDDACRAIVLTGAGEKAFVAGADIAEIRSQAPIEAHAFSAQGQRLMRRIESASKPVIAAVNGFALGGGLELALACHVRIASENARLGLPEIKLGLLPGFGGTQRLPRLIGRGRALQMTLTGEPVDAKTAEGYGLVQEVVAAGEAERRAIELGKQLAGQAPLAVQAILAAVDAGLDMPVDAGLQFETARFAVCCATEDMQEGTGAFLEKRRPGFSGR
ncbi:MAG: enoyl-CoA hydratase/isomerase family protein [Candidatus Wenzhouxiangella sp. M2_3B_020]